MCSAVLTFNATDNVAIRIRKKVQILILLVVSIAHMLWRQDQMNLKVTHRIDLRKKAQLVAIEQDCVASRALHRRLI